MDLATSCTNFVCFAPLDRAGVKFFGFSEFLAALALLVLAWTNADFRYRFRVATAPIPIYRVTFWMVVAIGSLTLVTDLWRAEGLPVPVGSLISPAGWQALLGAAFLCTFVMWIWFAFIKPPIFSRWNSSRFAGALFSTLMKADGAELRVIAEEVRRSARSLVERSWLVADLNAQAEGDPSWREKLAKKPVRVRTDAYNILQMVGDKKFCRSVVEGSPPTARELLGAVSDLKRFDVPIDVFAKNITEEAIGYRDSFVYHEVDGYDSGYIGHHKPLTSTIYGNFELGDNVRLFDVDYRARRKWDGGQWEAFGRLVLMCLGDFVEKSPHATRFSSVQNAASEIADSLMDLHLVDGASGRDIDYDSGPAKKLRVAIGFAREMEKLLDRLDQDSLRFELRRRDERFDLFGSAANLMSDAVFAAATVKGPTMTSWGLQYSTVWGRLFELRGSTLSERIVRQRLFRLLFKDISEMDQFPNYKGMRILGMMLNVMGLQVHEMGKSKGYAAFHRLVLWWTRENFARLYKANPELVEACLPAAMSYDPRARKITKTFEKGLSRRPTKRTLVVHSVRSRRGS